MAKQSPTLPLFQVIRRGARPNKTVTLPITLAACSAGTAFIEGNPPKDQDASGVVALADGSEPFAGFVTRDVLAAVNGVPAVPVPTYAELSTGGNPNIPYETAFSAGTEASLEDADEYEAEGPSFVSSGNGGRDITAATALGTRLSFYNGVTCIAQTGNWSEYYLAEQETPSTPGNVRIRARRIAGTTV
jgi:hypothetical protein